jgi:hypothetical protein
MGPSGGLKLDGDLLAYSSMAISPFSGLFLVAIHTFGLIVGEAHARCQPRQVQSASLQACRRAAG